MKVLIGYDGSESADQIFEDLKRAGLPRETEAIVASVGDLLMSNPSVQEAVVEAIASRRVAASLKRAETHAARVLAEATEFAERGRQRLQSLFPDWQIRAEVFTGSPAWVLMDAAGNFEADLIVLGSEGRGALGRLFLGSVSKRVATDAKCSVRVARFNSRKNEDEPPRVIIGVDGSLASEEAIYAVGHRVWQDGTQVKLIAVDDAAPPARVAARLPQAAAMINDYFSSREARVSAMLEWAIAELNHIGLKPSVLREKGDPKSVLINEARKWNADSIFVGTRDFKNAFERFRLGSVSTAVVTNAHCSVEIVRPPETRDEQT
jgi:nucleotide-binding universal stress UspA family protein